jgi:hypothetical protein
MKITTARNKDFHQLRGNEWGNLCFSIFITKLLTGKNPSQLT